MPNYRYPGIQPFTAEESHIFFGRDRAIKSLYRTIRQEPISVLYSKSGLGKSSLLNAGLFPYAKDKGEFETIMVRFGAWTEGSAETPLTRCYKRLGLPEDSSHFLNRLSPFEKSLWTFAKHRQSKSNLRPLIVFDQFEELFTYPTTDIEAFAIELSELIYTELPLRFRRRLEASDAPELSETEEELLDEPMDPAVLFAIRSDRMHLVPKLTDHLSGVLNNLFELSALDQEDARSAITKPAALKTGTFKTPPFNWEPAALGKLLSYLSNPDEEDQVEGILLQMLCREYEEKIIEEKSQTSISEKDIGNPAEIIAHYYASRIDKLDPSQRLAARKFIEEGLILDGENIRLSLHEAQINKQYKVEEELLESLVNSRLLRAEPFLRGGYTYEIAHDRLVEPILNAKKVRLEQERIHQEAVAQSAAQKELQAERKKRKRARRIAIFSSTLSALALIAMLFAFLQFKKAKANEELAKEELCKALQSERGRLQAEARQKRKEATTFEKAKEWQYMELREAQADSLDVRIIEIESDLSDCN